MSPERISRDDLVSATLEALQMELEFEHDVLPVLEGHGIDPIDFVNLMARVTSLAIANLKPEQDVPAAAIAYFTRGFLAGLQLSRRPRSSSG